MDLLGSCVLHSSFGPRFGQKQSSTGLTKDLQRVGWIFLDISRVCGQAIPAENPGNTCTSVDNIGIQLDCP